MKEFKNIGFSLVIMISLVVSFIGCGGGGGSSGGTIDTVQIGYLADSGIEGLYYETSSGKTGITGNDGKYEFNKDDTVIFKLGNLKFGNSVTASTDPITPMTLYNVDKSNYKNNAELVNVLRFLQTLDNDNYHGNGIKIDSDTFIKFRDTSNIDFNSESSVKNTLTNLNINKSFMSEIEAKRNMDETLYKIDNNILITDNQKVKKFQNYSNMWFSTKKRSLDMQVNNALDLTQVYSEVATDTLDVLTSPNLVEASFESIKNLATNAIKNSTESQLLSRSAGTLANVAFGLIKAGNQKVDADTIAELSGTLLGLGIDITSILGDTFVKQKKQFQYIVDAIALGYKLETSIATKVIGKLKDTKKEIIGFIPNIIADIGTSLIEDKNETITYRINTSEKFLELYYLNNENDKNVISYIKNKYNIEMVNFSNEPLTGPGSTVDNTNKDIVYINENISYSDILRVIAKLYEYNSNLDTIDLEVISTYIAEFRNKFDPYYVDYLKKQLLLTDKPIIILSIPKTKFKINELLKINAKRSKSFVEDNTTLTYFWEIDDSFELANTTNSIEYNLSSLSVGEHYLKLTATDANRNSESVAFLFNILENIPPVADAGKDITINSGSEFILDASASYDDEDGKKNLEYLWTNQKTGGTSSKKQLTIYSMSEGIHTFTLKVTDSYGESDTDTIQVTIKNILKSYDGIYRGTSKTTSGDTSWCGTSSNVTLTLNNGYVSGNARVNDGSTTYLTGTISENGQTTATGSGSWNVVFNGTLSGDTISGSWSISGSCSGTWSATK